MKRYLYIIFLWGLYCPALAQEYSKIVWLADPSCNPPACWHLQDSTIRDTVRYRIYYQLQFIPDTVREDHKTTMMVYEYGQMYNQYYSLAQRFENRFWTNSIKQTAKNYVHPSKLLNNIYTDNEKRLKAYAGNVGYANGEIWFNHFNKTLTERVADLNHKHQLHAYTEPIPAIEWNVSDQTDSLYGYQCIRADCQFRGRDWTAWFTPELPLNYGPWKFNGLPGLILKLYDRQRQYVWVIDNIEKVFEPMVYHNVPIKTYSKEIFNKLQINVHKHPYEAINGGMGTTRITSMDKGIFCEVDVNIWILPYNPIERE